MNWAYAIVIQQRARRLLPFACGGTRRSSAIVTFLLRLNTAQEPVRVQTLGSEAAVGASMKSFPARGA